MNESTTHFIHNEIAFYRRYMNKLNEIIAVIIQQILQPLSSNYSLKTR